MRAGIFALASFAAVPSLKRVRVTSSSPWARTRTDVSPIRGTGPHRDLNTQAMACLLAPTTTGIFWRGTFLRPRHCLTPPGTTATLQWVRTMVVAAAGWGRVRRREFLIIKFRKTLNDRPPRDSRAPTPLIPVGPTRALPAGDPGRSKRRVGVAPLACLEQPTGPAGRSRPGRRRSTSRGRSRGTSRGTSWHVADDAVLDSLDSPPAAKRPERTPNAHAPSPSPLPRPSGPRNFWRPRPDMAALVAPVHPRRAPPRPSTYAFLRVPPPRAPSTRPLPCVRRISPMSLAMRTLLFARSTPSAPVARAHRPSNALELAKRAANEFSNGATRRQRHLDPPTPPRSAPVGPLPHVDIGPARSTPRCPRRWGRSPPLV
jgi:hypothetical protein